MANTRWAWDVIKPQASINRILDPSFEALAVSETGNPWTIEGSAAPDHEWSYRGPSSLKLDGYYGSEAILAVQPVSIPSETYVTASAWVLITAGSPVRLKIGSASYGGTTLGVITVTPSLTPQRISLVANVTGYSTVYFIITGQGIVTGYVDACQLEDGDTLTTYLDGMEDGCTWSGRPQLSTSFRPQDCRSGGIAIPLSTYIAEDSMQGWGRASHNNVMLPFGLQGGSVYQRSVKQSRVASIVGHIKAGSGGIDDLHNAQASLGRLLGQDRTMPQLPVRLIYNSGATAGTPLATDCIYEGGLEFNSLSGLTLTQVPLRFHAPDPVMSADKENASAIAAMASGASMYYKSPETGAFNPVAGVAQTGLLCGEWVTPPLGATSTTRKLWLGGVGASSDIPGLVAFDPQIVTLSDVGTGVISGEVCAIKQTGIYVWIAGTFTGVGITGGGSASYLARINLLTGAIDQPIVPGASVYTMAYDSLRDTLWVGGGNFTGSTMRYLFQITSASSTPTQAARPWTDLVSVAWGSGTTVNVCDSCVDPLGNLYIIEKISGSAEGDFLFLQGQLGETAFTSFAIDSGTTAVPNHASGSMVFGPDGLLYIAGQFATAGGLFRYNGSNGMVSFTEAVAPTWGRSFAFDSAGRIHISGLIYADTPGSISAYGSPDSYVIFDKLSMYVEDVGSQCTGTTPDTLPLVFINPSDDSVLFISNESSLPSTAYTSVPVSAIYEGTAPAPVSIMITNTTSGYSSFGGVRNETTDQAILFSSLILMPGETVYIETKPGSSQVYSDVRGDLMGYVSPGSDVGKFVLLEGNNSIAVLCSGEVSGYVVWRDRHYGIDGAGSNIASA